MQVCLIIPLGEMGGGGIPGLAPSHPIAGLGEPAHPIYRPPGSPSHPWVPPGGQPSHPIAPPPGVSVGPGEPGYPAHLPALPPNTAYAIVWYPGVGYRWAPVPISADTLPVEPEPEREPEPVPEPH